MQFYLVAIPVALLWFHSMYVLLEKYKGEEFWWLRTYLLLGSIYIIAIPSLAIMDLIKLVGLNNGIQATFGGITALLMILLLVNKTPKNNKNNNIEA
ncbi:hypothetical protein AB3Z07_05150 [Metabacillus halosaccharovorans]|uniref:hypothetical protein n=1 Tax=Metabacillus halosaccharovorans TaxID=930124 RepID=UPI0034CD87CC